MRTSDFKPQLSRGRRRISVNLSEPKTILLYKEARRLLALADFEDISIARIAKEAGTSVGAFYVRFADKDVFLDFITSNTFGSARRGFAQVLPSVVSLVKPSEALADALIGQMSGAELAGIVRLAVKRGFSDLRNRRPFNAYRQYVADDVIGTLPDSAKDEQKVALELAIQSAFGVLTDAITSKPYGDPLKLSEYYEVIVGLLDRALNKMKLEEPKLKEPAEQSGVKKI